MGVDLSDGPATDNTVVDLLDHLRIGSIKLMRREI